MRQLRIYRRKVPRGGTCLSLALALLGAVILFPAGAVADGVSPSWRQGDTWSVRVSYATQEGGWSEPVPWEYRVAAAPGATSGGYTLEVTGPGAEAALVYRSDHSLAGVKIVRALRGRRIVTTLGYEAGAPVLTERSPVPFDTPLFPLVPSASGDYHARRAVGEGLHVTVAVKQTVIPTADDAEALEVTCTGGDERYFVQRWEPGRPWPVSGENPGMRYWLVEE